MKSLQYKIDHSKEFPFELHLDVTNHCNMSCKLCPMADRYKENIFPLGYMDFELYKQIIDECHSYHKEGYEINLHKDGEPLLHEQIGDMIKYAKGKGAFVHFSTNGLLLPFKKQEILDSGLDLLTVSLMEWTQTRSLAKFMETKNGQKPFTQAKLFAKLGMFEIPEVDKVICGNIHKFTEPSWEERKVPCPKLLYNPSVTWDGKFTICCVDYKREGVIGNLNNNTIRELWQDVRNIYSNQKKGNFSTPCNKCDYWETLKMEEN